ncbi:MAG: gliding motility-associated C-terminal domain-containing protein [Cyclobacteriaceae bacterium]|nr:gliding motility-associated C-terminal domain-containing protein [Cyclobacteriaceae bacterium]
MNRLKRIKLGLFAGLFFVYASASSFTIPTYTHSGNVTVNQNSGANSFAGWASNFSIPEADRLFIITSLNLSGSLTFVADPAVSQDGTLTFTPTDNTSGSATFNIQLKDLSSGDISGPSTIQINVTFVNTAPTFDLDNPDITVDEKAGAVTITGWATNISAGPNPEENNQDIHFVTEIVSQSAFMSFNVLPKVNEFGTFSFEAKNKANGTATINVYLQDDGPSDGDNENTSAVETITLTINPINDAPTFVKGQNIIIDEHTGPVSMEWATQIDAGAPDENVSQSLTFVLTEKEVSGGLQFDTPPSIDPITGTITFEATPYYTGFAIYEVILQDDGPSNAPNMNTSSIQAFTITVNSINDPPTFDEGADITVEEGDIVHTYENWATNISPGPSPDEQDQQLHFTVNFNQVTGTLAFLLAPQIDVNGTLSFRPTEHTHGEAVFDVYLTDDGPFGAPNENTSEVKTLTITVTPVNYPPNDIRLSNQTVLEQQPVGTRVGSLTTSDLDPEDTHNYALVAGDGSEGNEFFSIDGDQLVTNTSFNWDEGDTYSVRIKSSDGEFSIEKKFSISILKLIEGVKFANAITPNGDGQNDSWEIEDIDAFPDALVYVYNKAGLVVFKSSGGYTPWDGTYNGKSLPMGTYYYVIDLRDGSPVYEGTLTIIL